ncbi:MAG: M14 family metallopeptidase [Lachnospiraceae bacterium]|nr:M14 family metallopeptidase [Lachnospiraceae bacterium]
MKKEIIYELESLYRDNLRITGYHFGGKQQTIAIAGAFRGNEIQQLYICSQIIETLKRLEAEGKISRKKGILIIPSANHYGMNTGKRFWAVDNTDINRMFPGYNLGETTQRIADGIFQEVKDYEYGIHFTSFYIPGNFAPHVRMMATGFEDVEDAYKFGLPYVMLRDTTPFDTTTLNYNWQIWETKAFSIYTKDTNKIDLASAKMAVAAVLRFLNEIGCINYSSYGGFISRKVTENMIEIVKTEKAGLFRCLVDIDTSVRKGDVLAEIVDPYEGYIVSRVLAPCDGTVFFHHDEPLVYENTIAFQMIKIQ